MCTILYGSTQRGEEAVGFTMAQHCMSGSLQGAGAAKGKDRETLIHLPERSSKTACGSQSVGGACELTVVQPMTCTPYPRNSTVSLRLESGGTAVMCFELVRSLWNMSNTVIEIVSG